MEKKETIRKSKAWKWTKWKQKQNEKKDKWKIIKQK